ncbi:RDD family protein [Salinibacterium sp.]|uniref:RDD family protein n=1 Tax=Salinibacterium sp. TaxID=1915057 RepID=UPI00286ADCC7|nr:RDD family protein [Salinibacterium sp.]
MREAIVRSIPVNRLVAWLVDWLVIVVWVAIVAAVGVPLFLADITAPLTPIALNLVAFVTLALPVTVAFAALESSSREASLGKRARRLRVVDSTTGLRVTFWRALVRNTLKIAVPWSIGHAAAYGFVVSSSTGAVPAGVVVVTALAYALPLLYVLYLFIGSGRTPYDRLSGTMVKRQ